MLMIIIQKICYDIQVSMHETCGKYTDRIMGKNMNRSTQNSPGSTQNSPRSAQNSPDKYVDKNTGTLSALLAQDKESVMSRLQGDRSQEMALKTLETETDRLMIRAGGPENAGEQAEVVQGMLQVVKSALPLVESVSEVETWEREQKKTSSGRFVITPLSALCMIGGIACVIAGLVGQSIAGKVLRPGALIWTVIGCVLLMTGGYLTGRGKKEKHPKNEEHQVRQTFLVDPARIWHILQGIALSADHSLEQVIESRSLQEMNDGTAGTEVMGKDEMQFFSDLLENAYARSRHAPSDTALREQIESIRYYLHTRGIETEDYSTQSAAWFEILPSSGQSVTIRPAMLRDGVVIRRGLASV